LCVAPDDDGVWLWQDTYLVIGALIFYRAPCRCLPGWVKSSLF